MEVVAAEGKNGQQAELSGAWSKDIWKGGVLFKMKSDPRDVDMGDVGTGTHPSPLTLNLQMLFSVDDFW